MPSNFPTATTEASGQAIPFETVDFVSLQMRAERVAQSATVAYWLSSYGDHSALNHHLDEIVKGFDQLKEWVDLLRETHPHFAKQAEAA